MKTVIIQSIKGLRNLDLKYNNLSILKNNEWRVFQENSNEIEKFIFQDDKKILVSINGITHFSQWDYINVNHNLRIVDSSQSYMFKPIVCDSNLIMLKLDGTDSYCFLLNNQSQKFKKFSMEEIQWYLFYKYKMELFNESERGKFLSKLEHEKDKISNKKTQEQGYYPIIFLTLIILIGIILAAIFS